MGAAIGGFFTAIGINIALSVVLVLTGVGAVLVAAIGVVQLVYIVPVCIRQWNKKRTFVYGLMIGAAVTFLINSLCWGVLLQGFS
ncbi:MAG: hypothetical protein J7639_03035 [Paenibacillaceae bacterium]|nr:hypothetical protein [Paenibacillaceae bacterium]